MRSANSLYADRWRRSIDHPEEFWAEAAEAIDWSRRWDRVLDDTEPRACKWFTGAELNTCWNALDRHVARGRGQQTALIYDSPVTGIVRAITYQALLDEVRLCAGALRGLGVKRGDRVIIYMPMVPQAAVAMLACARIGAVHSVVFGGFAARELATRIDDAAPRVVIAASCGIEPNRLVPYKPALDEAIELSRHKPEHCLILQREQLLAELTPGRDVDWDEALAGAMPADCVSVRATDPLYILYTSGTTGQPKGIVRDNGGHAVALSWSLRNVYAIEPGETFWGASDIGWVVGHSYIVYGPLIYGATAIMFEGKPVGTPDASAYWRVLKEHRVAAMFCAPTAFRSIRREDPNGELLDPYRGLPLRALFLAGEHSDADMLDWLNQLLDVPTIDHWWQTETGWPVSAVPLGIERFETPPGSVGRPLPGWNLRALDDDGHPVAAGEMGTLACKLPLPPGALTGLWNADNRFAETYLSRYPGYYHTADAGIIEADGSVRILARTDDIINVAGHRLSTAAMEEVLSAHPDVSECAVIGVADALKGQLPLGLLVLHQGAAARATAIAAEIVASVRCAIGPVAAFRNIVLLDSLPRTRSGKVLRATLKAIADGTPWSMPATIENPDAIDEAVVAITAAGYPSAATDVG